MRYTRYAIVRALADTETLHRYEQAYRGTRLEVFKAIYPYADAVPSGFTGKVEASRKGATLLVSVSLPAGFFIEPETGLKRISLDEYEGLISGRLEAEVNT